MHIASHEYANVTIMRTIKLTQQKVTAHSGAKTKNGNKTAMTF